VESTANSKYVANDESVFLISFANMIAQFASDSWRSMSSFMQFHRRSTSVSASPLIGTVVLVLMICPVSKARAEANPPTTAPTTAPWRQEPVDPAVAAIPRKIVFVCQGGDSIKPKLDSLKLELTRAVQNLKPIQSTDVVIYEDQKPLKADDHLLICNSSNKRLLEHWIADLAPSGDAADPTVAMTFALKLKPNLVYFLADSAKFADVPGLLDVFHKLNSDHATKVNTILLVDSKEEQVTKMDSEAVMKQIAEENGGHFRWVTKDEVH
jgi:hypothetical protein